MTNQDKHPTGAAGRAQERIELHTHDLSRSIHRGSEAGINWNRLRWAGRGMATHLTDLGELSAESGSTRPLLVQIVIGYIVQVDLLQ